MKQSFLWVAIRLLLLGILALPKVAAAQNTAFSYQGALGSGGVPASGSYDLQFTLYPGGVSSNSIAGPVTNLAVVVSNGQFNTIVDFGPGAFNGNLCWLSLAVRTNGNGLFTTLSPRQQITPMPWAIYANSAGNLAASNLAGTLPVTQITGLGSAATSSAAAFYPASNPAGFVTAAITNVFPAFASALTLTNANNVIFTGWNPYSQGQFKTPPKGINGWFATSLDTEAEVINVASNMFYSGMVANGFNTILFDGGSGREAPWPIVTNGVVYSWFTNKSGWLDFDTNAYPDGAAYIIKKCHNYGVKVFLYAFNNPFGSVYLTGGAYGTNIIQTIQPGYYGSSYYMGWLSNAITVWGLDGIKDEISGGNYTNAILQQALVANVTSLSGHPFYVNVASYGGYHPWYRGLFNSWRICVGIAGDETTWPNMYAAEDNMPYWVAMPGSINDFDEMSGAYYWNTPFGSQSPNLFFRNELAFDAMANTALLTGLPQYSERYAPLREGQFYENYDNPLVNAIDDDFTDYLHLVNSNALMLCYTRALSDGSQAFIVQNRNQSISQNYTLAVSNWFPTAPFVTVHDIFRNAPVAYATNTYPLTLGPGDVAWFKLLAGAESNLVPGTNVLTFMPWSASLSYPAGYPTVLMSPNLNWPQNNAYWPMPNSWRQAPNAVTNTTAIAMSVEYTNSFTWFLGGQAAAFKATIGVFPSGSTIFCYGDGNLLTSFSWSAIPGTTNIIVPLGGVYNFTITATNAGSSSVYLGDPTIVCGTGGTSGGGSSTGIFSGIFNGVYSGNGEGLTTLSPTAVVESLATADGSTLIPVTTTNPLPIITNWLTGAGITNVNTGYADFHPDVLANDGASGENGFASIYSGYDTNGNYTGNTNFLTLYDNNTSVCYYYSTNQAGTGWFSTAPSFNPPPVGNYTTTYITTNLSLGLGTAAANQVQAMINSSLTAWTPPASLSLNTLSAGTVSTASLMATNTIQLGPNSTAPAPAAWGGLLWNSNNALYWVTSKHTNYITGP